MVDKIIKDILNDDKFKKDLIEKSDINRVNNELTNIVKQLKKSNYNEWFLLDQLIGEFAEVNQKVFFKAGFETAIKLINEIKSIK